MNNISYIILACYPDKGMKSHGSKGLMVFNQEKLFDHQINIIEQQSKNKNYEIIILSNFDVHKIIKNINRRKVRVVELENNKNPIHFGCSIAQNSKILFIDYGLVFNKKALSEIRLSNTSEILCSRDKRNNLEVGCVITTKGVEHLFFGVDEYKFCNMFYICESDYEKIIANTGCHAYNLLYFEIINFLISDGSPVFARYTDNKNFVYFNHMRQKNGINKFIKTNY